MEVARDALRAAGMDLSWDSSSETGRSVVFTSPAAGSVEAEEEGSTPLLSVQCVAVDPTFAKETDVVVLVAAPGAAPVSRLSAIAVAPKPVATVIKCADDASYLTTGRASFAVPSTTASAPSGVHAMLLAPAPAGAAVMEDMKAMHFAKIVEKEISEKDNKAEEEAVEDKAEEAEAATTVSRVPMSVVSTARYTMAAAPEPAGRRISEAPPSEDANPLNCGGDNMPPCQTEEEKKREEKVQEGEANFAMLVAFVGCVAIVRAANKYARNPE